MTSEAPAISELLKKARKARGLTVKTVAQDICVQSSYLKAIESGEFEKLPAHTFAVGFVRSYANALGEDADEVVASFKAACGVSKPEVISVPPSRQPEPKKRVPTWLSPFAGLIGASLCWIALGGSLGGTTLVADVEEEIASEKAQLAALQMDISEAVDNENIHVRGLVEASVPLNESENALLSPDTVSSSFFMSAAYADVDTPAVISSYNALLKATEDSWVRVARQDGTELWSGILRAGQTYRPHEAGLVLLTTSNAGGLMIQQQGTAAIQLGVRGEIVSDYALSAENGTSHSSKVAVLGIGPQ